MTRTFTPDEIAVLIAKLEAATGPDREIDTEVWLLVTPGATRQKWSYTHKATARLCEVDETRQADGRLIIVPTYTASIDAALTLVPEGCNYLIGRGRTRPDEPIFGAIIFSGPFHDNETKLGGGETNASLAIALCIAALKARASIRDGLRNEIPSALRPAIRPMGLRLHSGCGVLRGPHAARRSSYAYQTSPAAPHGCA